MRLRRNLAYSIQLEKHAQTDLRNYSKSDQAFIVKKLRSELVENPFPRGKTIRKIEGKKHTIYRLRINASQSYRAFYGITSETIIIYRIVPKKDAEKVIKSLH